MGFHAPELRAFRDDLRQSGVGSVDAFLEYRPEFIHLGKTAIAEALIPFEDEEKLFSSKNNWMGYLLEKLNAPLDKFDKNRLSVITFNYDRSVEWYLFKALRARYGLNPQRAQELLHHVPIIHVHGILGGLPWEQNGREYIPRPERNGVYLARERIKIIHEEIKKDPEFEHARQAMINAHRIIYLGFGYHPVNVQRIATYFTGRRVTHVFGSAFGLTKIEQASVLKRLSHQCTFGNADWDVLRTLRELVDLED
jgi:hypothetical protein